MKAKCAFGRSAGVDQKFERAEIVVEAALASSRALVAIFSRNASVSHGDGATSINFWLRRWIVHSLAEMHEVAMPVAENLDFDMPRAVDQSFRIEIHRRKPIRLGLARKSWICAPGACRGQPPPATALR